MRHKQQNCLNTFGNCYQEIVKMWQRKWHQTQFANVKNENQSAVRFNSISNFETKNDM